MNINNVKIGVIGLGYVGLPLAVEFGKVYSTVGFDINPQRILELLNFEDHTKELTKEEIQESINKNLLLTNTLDDLSSCNVYIITVPTPIDEHNKPDLTPLISASTLISRVINVGDIVIYESTVYPGATEEDCIPVIESGSGLTFNVDFFAGYSPERINPGDKSNRLTTIKKVTSGSNEEVANFVDQLYASVIKAGTYKAKSIKVAEAAKVIENVQRDVNIALFNEFFQIFERMNIDTIDVINAAATKWNFMKLTPGLVGGHCIGVDPYYLLHKAESYGYVPDLIRTSREINNGMSEFLVNKFLTELLKKSINPINLKVLLLGFSFKENCPDIRNTKVLDVYKQLVKLGFNVDIFDPVVNSTEVFDEYGVRVANEVRNAYDVGFFAVGHDAIKDMINEIDFKFNYIFDYKSILKN